MSNREDYLDSLLKSVTDSEAKEIINQGPEDDFLKEYDQDLLNLDDDDFLKEFEKELEREQGDPFPSASKEAETGAVLEEQNELAGLDDLGLDELNGLDELDDLMVDTMEQEPPQTAPEAEDGGEMIVNTMDDDMPEFEDKDLDAMLKVMNSEEGQESDSDTKQEEEGLNLDFGLGEEFDMKEDLMSLEERAAGGGEEKELTIDDVEDVDDAELLDILAGLTSDEDLEDIGNMLKAHDEDTPIAGAPETSPQAPVLEEEDESEKGKKKGKKKKEKKEKKKGKSKLARLLFGDDEDEEIVVPESGEIEHISDENMEILKELEQSGKKNDKKKEKKAKKTKEKKEKKPKEKKPKPPKEKKEKKPKAPKEPPVKSKPLPKVPVFLTFLLVASLLVLIFLGSNLVGYSTGMEQAQQEYDKGNYVEAYQRMRGMKIKEVDQDFYNKARLAAYLKQELDSFDGFIGKNMYPEALDSLIVAVGKHDKFLEEAKTVNADGEFGELLQTAEKNLEDTFQATLEEAREIYGQKDRNAYTSMLYKLLQRAGMAQ